MSLIGAIGWTAAALSLATALMQTMIPLRWLAAAANAAFIAHALLTGALPALVTHCILLPLNLHRLAQMHRLIRDMASAAEFGLSADWLAPFAAAEERKAGAVLFHKGDAGDRLYYLCAGRVQFVEIEVEISAGALFGEVAFFIPEGHRTQTAVCATDCRLLSITEGQLKQLYFQNPRFGWYLVRLIAERLSRNARRLEERAPPAPAGTSGAAPPA